MSQTVARATVRPPVVALLPPLAQERRCHPASIRPAGDHARRAEPGSRLYRAAGLGGDMEPSFEPFSVPQVDDADAVPGARRPSGARRVAANASAAGITVLSVLGALVGAASL